MRLFLVEFEVQVGGRFEDSGKAIVCSKEQDVSEVLGKELMLESYESLIIKKQTEINEKKAFYLKE